MTRREAKARLRELYPNSESVSVQVSDTDAGRSSNLRFAVFVHPGFHGEGCAMGQGVTFQHAIEDLRLKAATPPALTEADADEAFVA